MTKPEFSYIGSELELFRHADNWKAYYGSILQPFLGMDVLEVGAGIGGTTAALCQDYAHASWTCLEPDGNFCSDIESLIDGKKLPAFCEVRVGTLAVLPHSQRYDTILYIDVLEHIEQDLAELENAARRLKPGGHLVVLAPAHQFLFSPFDQAVGHYRRYSRASLQALTPAGQGLNITMNRYLDACGVCLSLANKFVLKKENPSKENIRLWDSYVVPLSRVIDPLLRYRLGKSVLTVWQKQNSSQ